MSLDSFIEYLKRLYDSEVLTKEELDSVDRKASELVDAMAAGDLDYDTQNAIDLYVEHYDGENLSPERTRILLKYHNIIENRKMQELEREKMNKPHVYRIKPINSDGIISAVAIIELVVIGGALIAILTLALLKI